MGDTIITIWISGARITDSMDMVCDAVVDTLPPESSGDCLERADSIFIHECTAIRTHAVVCQMGVELFFVQY